MDIEKKLRDLERRIEKLERGDALRPRRIDAIGKPPSPDWTPTVVE